MIPHLLRVLLVASSLLAVWVCDDNPPAPEDGQEETFAEKLARLDWVAYAPTDFDPTRGRFPETSSIRADLQLLRQHGFEGLITYAADGTLAEVPRIARSLGFSGMIMGVFMGTPQQLAVELPNAIAAAEWVDGYAVGNEGLEGCGGTAYTAAELEAPMQDLRAATGKPVATSEQFEDYLDGGCLDGLLLELGDWLFPIVHPFNNGVRDPEAGADFTATIFQRLDALTGKPVLLKETGWPTCGDPAATEQAQEGYFLALGERDVMFAYFEAFDQPFKGSPTNAAEACWGLFRSDRTTKRFISGNGP